MAHCGIITLEEQEEEEDEEDTNPEDEPDVTNTDSVFKQISSKQITYTDEHLLEEDPDDKHFDEHMLLEEKDKMIGTENIADEGLRLEEMRKTLGELYLRESFQTVGVESESASGSPQNVLEQMENIEILDQMEHTGVNESGNIKQIINVGQTLNKNPALWLGGENSATTTNLTTSMPNLNENRDDMTRFITNDNPIPNMGMVKQGVHESDDANQIAEIYFSPLANPLRAFEQRGQITFKEYTGKSTNLNESIGQISNKSTSENVLASVPSVNLGSILQTSSIVTRMGWRGGIGEEAGKYKTFNNNVNTVRINNDNNNNSNYNNGGRRICSWHNVGFCRRRNHCRDYHPTLVCKQRQLCDDDCDD